MLTATLHEQEIRRIVGVPGEGQILVQGVSTLNANEDRCLFFINRELPAVISDSVARRNECIVVVRSGMILPRLRESCRVLEVSHPRASIAKVLDFIRIEGRQPEWVKDRKIAPDAVISPLAVVEGNVNVGEGVVIEPFCSVGPDVAIGRRSILRAGARVFRRVSIGEESVIGANSVVGTEGFGFVRDEAGNKTRIPHLGGVYIGSHVEIGSLTIVQSGTISPTVIEDHAKVDDHVHVGHNSRIGRSASVTAGVIICGSVAIETEAWVGVNSSIRNSRRVGARALVGMDSSVQHDLPDDTVARSPRPTIRIRADSEDGRAIGFQES